jgi:hypothetical protein
MNYLGGLDSLEFSATVRLRVIQHDHLDRQPSGDRQARIHSSLS